MMESLGVMSPQLCGSSVNPLRVPPVIAAGAADVRRSFMPSNPLTELLKLSAGDRAELAMSLWESLSDLEREGQLDLSEAERAELDRRWAEHVAKPESATPWSVVRAKLRG